MLKQAEWHRQDISRSSVSYTYKDLRLHKNLTASQVTATCALRSQ